jgi:hypothetical protein
VVPKELPRRGRVRGRGVRDVDHRPTPASARLARPGGDVTPRERATTTASCPSRSNASAVYGPRGPCRLRLLYAFPRAPSFDP